MASTAASTAASAAPPWATGPQTWGPPGRAVTPQRLHHDLNAREITALNARGATLDLALYGDSITSVLRELRTHPVHGKAVRAWFRNWSVGFFGVPGNRAADLTWRLAGGSERLARDPRALVVWIGTNDVGAGASPVAHVAWLLGFLRKAHPRSRVVFLAMLPRRSGGDVREANAAIAAECRRLGCEFVSCPLNAGNRKHLPDGLHPSPAGYAKVFACLIPALLRPPPPPAAR